MAIGLAVAFFLYGRQGLFWDAAVYAQLGQRIAKQSLFQFNDDTRTFGYPLFIALIWFFSDQLPSTLRLLVFVVQLFIYLGACLLAFRVFRRVFPRIEWAHVLFAILVLNPFLLIYTGVVLSDLLSAVLDLAALLLAGYSPPRNADPLRTIEGQSIVDNTPRYAFLSFLTAGCATMVRPANLPIILALTGVWILRYMAFDEVRLRLTGLMAIGFCLPFIPQVINNYRAYGELQPLIVRSLYSEQLSWGMQYLKYASVVIPGDASGIAYRNPFLPSGVGSPSDLLLQAPLNFFLTQALHLFALFDHDYAFPYIVNLDVWYRVPLSILNYLFLFGAICGVLAWFPRALHLRSYNRLDLALASMLLGIAFYVPEYILTAVEPRFSLPLYLFLSPFLVYALMQGRTLVAQKNPKNIALVMLGLILFLAVNLSMYRWFRALVPILDGTGDSPIASSRNLMSNVQVQFGDRIKLLRYGVDLAHRSQGGEKLYLQLDWWCMGASIEPYQVQIDLVDSKNRVWSQMAHDPAVDMSPCTNRLWIPSQATDLVALRLPATMPGGKYHFIASIHDPTNDRYLAVQMPSGEKLEDHLEFGALSILKNKASFTASELFLKHPFFVDMNEMRFLGFADLPARVRAGDSLDIGLYWRARGKPQADYIVTVQLSDSLGAIISEQTARPAENTYPTTEWNEGEVLLDWHTLVLPPTIRAGEYQLAVILRDAVRGQTIGETQFAEISVAQ